SVQVIAAGANEYDFVTMIVRPVSVMPLVLGMTERLVKANIVLLVVHFFGLRVFHRFAHLGLRCRRGIVSRNTLLWICRRERSVLSPDFTVFMHRGQRA